MTRPTLQNDRLLRGLLVALAVALGLGPGSVAGALVSSSASKGFDEDEHDKYCGCGPSCRKESCCCGPPSRSEATAELPPPAAAADAAMPLPLDTNPCLRGRPCHDPAVPSGPAG